MDIKIKGIWLRRIGDRIQVLAERDDGWHLIIDELIDGQVSHIVEPSGIVSAPLDEISIRAT
jgi:hypothetical protein